MKYRPIPILMILCAALLASPAPAARRAPVAWLVASGGEVLVKRASRDADAVPEAVPAPAPLALHDDVEVHSGTAQVQLGSERIIELGPGTAISLLGARGRSDFFLVRGVVRVRPGAAGDGQPIGVALPGGRIVLRGPRALVRIHDGAAQVLVTEGDADVIGRADRVTVRAGQMAALRPTGALDRPVALTAVVARGAQDPLDSAAPPPGIPPVPDSPPATVVPTPDTGSVATPVPSAAPSRQSAEAQADRPFVEWTSLRVLRDKGYITQAEYDSAMKDMYETLGARAGKSVTLALGRWATTIYGFAQLDAIVDTTQSYTDAPANGQVARPDTYAGQHGRTQFSVRNSRLGVRVAAPALKYLRASAVLEMDFLGPGNPPTEAGFFNTPVPRVRHAYLKLETPIIDILFGQYWQLFGWQPSYGPAVLTTPGIAGEVFGRTAQLRLSHLFKTSPIDVELAAAVLRPPQRDSMVPDFQGGLRLMFNKWTAVHSTYMSATSVVPASIGVSGIARYLSLPNLAAKPMSSTGQTGLGIAANSFVPIIPATPRRRANSLSVLGEFAYGTGIADQYVGLTGGVPLSARALPAPTPGATAPTYPADYDPGLAAWDVGGNPRLPKWMTFLAGLEYYTPLLSGRIGLSGTVTRSQLIDAAIYGSPTKVRDHEWLYEAALFADVTEAVRLALGYNRTEDTYVDNITARNNDVHLSAFFFF